MKKNTKLIIWAISFSIESILFNRVEFTKKNYIFVGYVIGENNYYESLISIVSLLDNKNERTFANIYVIENSLQKESIIYLLSLQFKYSNFNISLISNNENIDNYNNDDKLILFLKNIKYFKCKKILYLNSDTLILKDLYHFCEYYTRKENYIGADFLSYKYVLLLNLRKIRKKNFSIECLEKEIARYSTYNNNFIEKHFASNRITKKIDFSWEKNCKILNEDQLFNSYEFPNIYYFNETKPYLNNFNAIYKLIWHKYANKTGKYVDIIHYFNLSFNINEVTELSIAISLNDGHTYPVIVTLTSLFETSSKLTTFDIYCVVPDDYLEVNKKKILSLLNIYPNKGKIHFILVSNFFPGKVFQYPAPNYYKLFYDKFLPKKLDKIILLEGDMIFLEDIRILNDLDISNKTYLGFGKPTDIVGIDDYIIAPYIINLKLIRTTNLTNLYKQFLNENYIKYKNEWVDEKAINFLNQGRKGRIPIKYSAPDWVIEADYFKNYAFKGIMIISKEEYESAKNNQALVHFVVYKPWIKKNCKFEKKWWYFAKKSGFLDEIMNYSSINNKL